MEDGVEAMEDGDTEVTEDGMIHGKMGGMMGGRTSPWKIAKPPWRPSASRCAKAWDQMKSAQANAKETGLLPRGSTSPARTSSLLSPPQYPPHRDPQLPQLHQPRPRRWLQMDLQSEARRNKVF